MEVLVLLACTELLPPAQKDLLSLLGSQRLPSHHTVLVGVTPRSSLLALLNHGMMILTLRFLSSFFETKLLLCLRQFVLTRPHLLFRRTLVEQTGPLIPLALVRLLTQNVRRIGWVPRRGQGRIRIGIRPLDPRILVVLLRALLRGSPVRDLVPKSTKVIVRPALRRLRELPHLPTSLTTVQLLKLQSIPF